MLQSSSEESSSAKVLQSEQLTTSSLHVCRVLLNVGDSVVDEGVRSKLSEAVKELVGVEGRLYCSLDGILGRNVKRVQDGLKRVRASVSTLAPSLASRLRRRHFHCGYIAKVILTRM